MRECSLSAECLSPCGCGRIATMNDYDTTEKVEETHTGYKLRVLSKRGTGTRDQDTVEAEAKTETLKQLEEERNRLHTLVLNEMEMLRVMPGNGEIEE